VLGHTLRIASPQPADDVAQHCHVLVPSCQ
jgi:hypothetical protein